MVLLTRPVICVFCRCKLSYHRSTSSLKYHLMAKHTADANSLPPRQSQAIAMLFSIKKIFAQSNPNHFSMLIRALKFEKRLGQKEIRDI